MTPSGYAHAYRSRDTTYAQWDGAVKVLKRRAVSLRQLRLLQYYNTTTRGRKAARILKDIRICLYYSPIQVAQWIYK